MKLINISKDIYLSQDLKEAASFSDKLLGMLKKSNSRGLMFKTRFGVHTFFLKKPIDVIILDKGLRVVKLKTVKPNKLFFWNPKYSCVLELPEGSIKKTQTKVGDSFKLAR